MELIFVRHGPAESKDDWQGTDEERPLSPDGKLLVFDVAASLVRHQMHPELILTSPYVRATQTAQIMADCLGSALTITVDKRLAPGFGLKQLDKLLRDHRDLQTMMLVGHDPDLSDVVRSLTGGGRLAIRKAGLAQVDLPDPQALKGRLISLIVPVPATR